MALKQHAIKPSTRALANLESGAFIDLENEAGKLPQYDPEICPDGLIDLSGAINSLMNDVLEEETTNFEKSYSLSEAMKYGDVMGPKGLSKAVSSFMNHYFDPARALSTDDIIVTNGVTSLIDMMAFAMCNPGEAIMVITPTYMMFPHDVCARSGVNLINVDLDTIEDQFEAKDSAKVMKALGKAYSAAQKSRVTPKALLLCNPSNPCGRTYPRATLIEIARFCGQRKMHLLSDEIYALSTFTPYDRAATPFTSVLSIPDDPENGVFTENIHCMYGASKDFGCGGLRLGFLVTRNQLLWRSVRRLVLFTWVTSFSAAFFMHFLKNEEAVDRYVSVYRERLGKQYDFTAKLLDKYRIPFWEADSGVFIFVKLTKWLDYFAGDDHSSREMKLCRHLLHEAGVFLSPGEGARPVHAVTYSSSPGTYILTGSADRTIRLYNPATQDAQPRYTSNLTTRTTPRVPEGRMIQSYASHGYEVLDLAVAADNERFASCGGDRAVFLWDVASATTLRRFGGNVHGHSSRINCVAFGGDGDSLVISAGFDTSVRVWDCKSNSAKPVQVMDEAKDSVTALVVRDAEIVAGSVDGRVRSYDVRMGKCITDTMGASVTSLKLTRDGKAMLVGSLDSKIRLMDRDSGSCLKTYEDAGWKNEELRVQSILGGKEKYVIAGDELTAGTGPAGLNGEGKIWAWDLLTGKLVATVKVPWPEGYEPKKKVLGKDGREKERSNVISCMAWRDDGWGDQFCVGGTSGVATVFGSL
ncbi:WD repeat domain-containing protein 83 [Colletotrichum sp. SAR 10_66]|nr:WD repeat domain-containing protein 83 [Colletotrichum sp. SAR 10_76]KAJ4997951.1 WD repeat domain-containing protein 83 [Colletotrichum sp. SAR 10_66]